MNLKYITDTPLLQPEYHEPNFSQIHSAILSLFEYHNENSSLSETFFPTLSRKPNHVVLIFIDALGWKFWQKPFTTSGGVQRILQEGKVKPIHSLFPSTTSASVTNLNIGVLHPQHALYEWHMYFPEYDDVLQSLIFSPVGVRDPDSALHLGYDPQFLLEWYIKKHDVRTLYQKLQTKGVTSYQFLPHAFLPSIYNTAISTGAQKIGYSTMKDGLERVKQTLRENQQLPKSKTLSYFYSSVIDETMHTFGPDSQEVKQKINEFWDTFEMLFGPKNFHKTDDTLFLFVADHGQSAVSPQTTYYLNLELPELERYMKRRANGAVIYPNGSARDVFLHIKDDCVDTALQLLQHALQDKALVITTQEAVVKGFFGETDLTKCSSKFLERVGQILILPYPGESVWWYEAGVIEMKKSGHHGGLSKEEVLTVFGVW